jgi:hypothetical protein
MNRLRRLSWLAYLLVFAAVPVVFSQRRDNVTVNVYTNSNPTPTPTPTPKPKPVPKPDPTIAAQKIKLYYLREATKITAIINAIAQPENSALHGLLTRNATEDEVIIYGSKDQRKLAWRIIATLDLPRPGVVMDMWGIQISSNKPEQMAQVMPEVRKEINRTQEAVRSAYRELQRSTLEAIPSGELDSVFRRVLVKELGYASALDDWRPLSTSDLLLRMIAARDPGNAAQSIANSMNRWFARPEYRDYLVPSPDKKGKATGQRKVPFVRFFRQRGLSYDDVGHYWRDTGQVNRQSQQAQTIVLDFALRYGELVHQPRDFDAYYLQQSAEALNTRLQAATDSLNVDMQEIFMETTLRRIGDIVRRFPGVEYAQVGKVSVATLSGVSTAVNSHSVNAFDVTPPLRLSELLERADKITKSVTPFDVAENTVGAMSLSQVIGLIGAFGDERAVWRELQSGVSVTVTPTVLRNMTSAELKIELKTGDPQAGTREQGVRPLSRVSQHDVNTSVYVNALDFFDLSAFVNQATLGGGRGMVPIIGPIWQGLFGEIPVAGKLFSWQKSPKTVYTDSLILTNSFITPTAMGIALLYPTQNALACPYLMASDSPEVRQNKLDACFNVQRQWVDYYKRRAQVAARAQ